MTRPQSIVRFEQLYVAAFVLGLISTVQSWSLQTAMLSTDARLAAMPWVPYAAAAVRIAIAVALWYFVARVGSVVAKWIVVLLAVLGALMLATVVFGLVSGTVKIEFALPLILQNILYIAATVMLFRPDTPAWFGETPAGSVA